MIIDVSKKSSCFVLKREIFWIPLAIYPEMMIGIDMKRFIFAKIVKRG